MMILQDTDFVLASQLLGGHGKDDNGNPIKFKQIEGAILPTYQAEADMNDGTGRRKIYTFDIPDTPVRVAVRIVEK